MLEDRQNIYEMQRRNMVNRQLRPVGITDKAVINAMSIVERHLFVDQRWREVAYSDAELPAVKDRRYLLRPEVLAKMLQHSGITKDSVVLDLACGFGYSSQVIALCAKKVVAVEEIDFPLELAHELLSQTDISSSIRFLNGTIFDGARQYAPFDSVIVNGRIREAEVLRPLFPQLKQNTGTLMVIEGPPHHSRIVRYRHDITQREELDYAAAEPLI